MPTRRRPRKVARVAHFRLSTPRRPQPSMPPQICPPFLPDDFFVNFDDQRAKAEFKVLADVAKSTQVLFFRHHPHLGAVARSVV